MPHVDHTVFSPRYVGQHRGKRFGFVKYHMDTGRRYSMFIFGVELWFESEW